MAMVYTLASYVKEWLDSTFVEDLRQAATAEIEAARRQEEEVRLLHPWACESPSPSDGAIPMSRYALK